MPYVKAEYLAKRNIEEEDSKKQFRLAEQDKLDYDLAMRLAPETNGEVEALVHVKR
jgi:hypothetical protein